MRMKLYLVVLCIVWASARGSTLVKQMSVISYHEPFVNDFGVFTNCGKSKLSGLWTPKDISSRGQITAYVNFTAPYNMNGGYIDVAVYKHADHSTVVEYGTPFSCDEVKHWIPCPVKEGQFLSLQKTIQDLSQLSGYQGVFDVEVYVENEDDQQMLCVKATVTVTDK